MANDENEKNPLSPYYQYASNLLGDLPQTDPKYLKLMETERLSQKHYAAVGRVASEWANLETYIDMFSLQIGKIDEPYGVCLTAQISGIERKFDAYLAIVNLRGAVGFVPKINKLIGRSHSLRKDRNRTVHDPWIFDEDGNPMRYEASAQKVHKQTLVEVSTVDLVKLSKDIEKLTDDVIALSREILAHVEASLKKA